MWKRGLIHSGRWTPWCSLAWKLNSAFLWTSNYLCNPLSPSLISFFFFRFSLCLLTQFPHGRTWCITSGPVIQYSGIMQHAYGICFEEGYEQGCPRCRAITICKTRVRTERKGVKLQAKFQNFYLKICQEFFCRHFKDFKVKCNAEIIVS
jgi:hypothetical protein